MQDVVGSNVYIDEDMCYESDDDEPYVYNVTCIKNRYDVLRSSKRCDDNMSMSNKRGRERRHPKSSAPSGNHKAFNGKSQKGRGQKCGFPGDRQMSASGGRQGKPTRVPHEGRQKRQKRSVVAMESVPDADKAGHGTLSWSTPNGKIVSHALGSLNSVPVIINTHSYRAMLDSGAGVNCVQKSVIDKLGMGRKVKKDRRRVLRDAQGTDMKVVGELNLPMQIGDTQLHVHCVVVNSLPLPVILGIPFLEQTEATMDFKQKTLTMKNSQASIIITPIVERNITFNTLADWYLKPCSETVVYCKAKLEPNKVQKGKKGRRRDNWRALDVQRSDTLFTMKSLIVKPSVAFRRQDGTYAISIINPLSKTIKLDNGTLITDGNFKDEQFYTPTGELPECVKLDSDNCLDRPLIILKNSVNECQDVSLDGEGYEDDISESGEQHANVAGIQILWPEQPYCPPFEIGKKTQTNRTVGCQVEVDVGNQTRIQTFKEINWEEILKLEPDAEHYRERLMKILKKHRPVFAADLSEIAVMEGVYYRIDLRADATPVNRRAFRMPPANEAELERQLSILREAEIIQPSSGSLWGAPAFVVYRHDEQGNPIKPRLVLDFSKTNEMIVAAKAPIPLVNEIIEHIGAGRNRVFSVVDLASAFYAIQLTEDSKEICAINTRTQKYCFNRLPMGAGNSPEIFSSLMSRCLSTMDSKHVLNYMDDILIMTKTYEEHLKVINQLFWRLRQAGLRISPKKVNFMQSSIKYLGYVFDKDGVRADPAKMEALVKLPAPKNIKNVREVMGCLNYYRRFVKDFSKISQPINELLKKDMPFEWTEQRQKALDTLKAALLKNAVLYTPDPNKPFIVCLDASGSAIGSVISQKGDDNIERPCVFMSKTLNECQIKYHSNDKETLALVESLKLCETLMGPHPDIEVYSDNLTNVYLDSLSEKSGRLFRYRMYLNRFNLDVKHKKGKLNFVADMLSRMSYVGQPEVSIEEEPDSHALINEGHVLDDPIISGEVGDVNDMPKWVSVTQDLSGYPGTKEKARHYDYDSDGQRYGSRFCMFDGFEEHNFPPQKRQTSNQSSTMTSNTRQQNKKSTYKYGSEAVQNDSDFDEADQPHITYNSDHDYPTVRIQPNTTKHGQTHQDDQRAGRQGKDAGMQTDEESMPEEQEKVDQFWSDEHGLRHEDIEGIQNQEVLNLYSQVLRNARVLATEQATDRDSADMYQYKLDKTLPEALNMARRVMAEEDKYYLTDSGVLYRKFHPQPGARMYHQLVLPSKHRFKIASLFHHGLHGSHRGFHALLYLVRRRFYWRGMYDDLLTFVASCHYCGAAKRDYSHVRTPLHLRDQCRAFEVCHMDVLKIAPTRGGEHKVMVMVDRFTKHCEIEPIEDERAPTLARVFLTSWIQRFGPPRVVILDRAAAHMSEVFRTLADQFNIKLNYIVGYHPESNSAVERLHSKILTSLRACMMEFPTKPWTSFLSHVRWSNDMGIQPNGFSPYELMYGLEPSLSGQMDMEAPLLTEGPPQDILECVWPDLMAMREAAARNARMEAENMKARYDQRYNTKYKGFKPGDLVWLKEVKPRIPSQYKVAPKFQGPLTVVSSPLPGFHMLRVHNEVLAQLFPEERLKPYTETTKCRLRTRVFEDHAEVQANAGNQRQVQGRGAHTVREPGRNAQTGRQMDGQPARPRPPAHQPARPAQRTGAKQPQPQTGTSARTHPQPRNRRQAKSDSRVQKQQPVAKDACKVRKYGTQQGKGTHAGNGNSGKQQVRPKVMQTRYNLRQRDVKQESDGRERPKERVERKATSPSVKARPVSAKPRRSQSSGSETDTSVEIARARKVMERQRKEKERRRKDDGAEGDSENSESEQDLPTIPQVVRRKQKGQRKAMTQAIRNNGDQNAYSGSGLLGTKCIQSHQDQRNHRNPHQDVKHQRSPLLISHGVNDATQEITSLPGIKRGKKGPKTMNDHGKIMTNHQGQTKVNREVLTASSSSKCDKQRVGAAPLKPRNSMTMKATSCATGAGIKQANKTDNAKRLDWSKFKKIVTTKSLVNGNSYLCAWKNRAPQWIKGSLVPQNLIEDYERRIKTKQVLRQLRKAHGNMN